MSGLTLSDRLPIGIRFAGEVHRDFTLRPAKVIDSIAAIDEVGSHNQVAVNAAVIARQLIRLGTIPAADINYELLCEMDPRDFNALDAATGELAKKALPAPDSTGPGLEPGSSLSGSGLPGETAAS